MNVKNSSCLFVSADYEEIKPYNVSAVVVNGNALDLEEDDVTDYIMAIPANWDAYEKYVK